MRTLLSGFVFLVLLAVPAVPGVAAPAAPASKPRPSRAAPLPPLPERVRQDSIRFAAGVNRTSFDSLNAVFARDIADARRQRDRGSLYRLLTFQGAGYALTGDALRALPVLNEAIPLIEAEADTGWLLVALRWRAYSDGSLGRLDDQERSARRLVAVAEASGNARFLAIGHNFLGWLARQRGDLQQARAHLELAVEGHRALHNESEEAFARIAYGATLTDLGEYEAARRSYARQLEIARRLKQGWTEAQAWNDLGVLERRIGDPGKAVEYFRRGYEGMRARGETPDLMGALSNNLAIDELELDRAENARKLALEGIEICERRGFTQWRGTLLVVLGSAEDLLGRPAAAEVSWRRAAALGDSATPETRAYAVLGLSRVLLNEKRETEALAVIQHAAKDLPSRLSRSEAATFYNGWANRLWHVGRHAEALAVAGRALEAARASAASQATVSAWGTIGSCRWELGEMAAAKVAFDSACVTWERVRGRSADAEWRASLWSTPGAVRFDATQFLLAWPAIAPESTRVAAAYERLQQFRSRTLLEQATRASEGATPAAPPVWSTARVQRELLADGELLLEWAFGEESVLLFAITRTERRVFTLLPAPGLRTKIRTARELLAAAPRSDADVAAAETVARELARAVFGDAMPMVERARSLVLVPDGEIYRVPFAALATRSAPLVDSRSIATTPSVAMLAQSRGRAQGGRRGLLAVAMGGGSGPRLAGAEREVAWLASSFDGVERAATGALDPAAFAPTLAPYDALHFAGHTEYDDRFPWRSGIDIGAPAPKDAILDAPLPGARGARAGRSLLRAETIAATRLSARLVVLSSCETASGRILAGEGLSGLSTAFLAGGAHTVVASLWAVDDRATETLMREFYRVLGEGRNASAALRMAQNRLRRDRQTRHPWYWGGFVLVGDGATTMDLRPTSPWRRMFQSKPLGHQAPHAPPTHPDDPLAPSPGRGL